MVAAIILIITGVLLVSGCAYEIGERVPPEKKTKASKKWERILCLVLGVIILVGSALVFYKEGSKCGILKTMRQRLSEPVISEAQLYGYEIVGKHMEEYGSSDDTSYFIDIRDTLTNTKTLKHIKVSQQLFERTEIGNCFDFTLMGKLKIPELETPAPEDL